MLMSSRTFFIQRLHSFLLKDKVHHGTLAIKLNLTIPCIVSSQHSASQLTFTFLMDFHFKIHLLYWLRKVRPLCCCILISVCLIVFTQLHISEPRSKYCRSFCTIWCIYPKKQRFLHFLYVVFCSWFVVDSLLQYEVNILKLPFSLLFILLDLLLTHRLSLLIRKSQSNGLFASLTH